MGTSKSARGRASARQWLEIEHVHLLAFVVLVGCGSGNANQDTKTPSDGSGGGGSGGSNTVSMLPPVRACPKDGVPGAWENVTPAQLSSEHWCTPMGNAVCPGAGMTALGKIGTYGSNSFVIAPGDSTVVYLGTSSLGIWKTTDCGSSWAHIDTGSNGAALDLGRNWTMLIDPTDPNVLYATAGYGQGGLFKSSNGGVDWTSMFTSTVLDKAPAMGFVEKLAMDPTNPKHITATFHGACTGSPNGGGSWACLAESTDAGVTWTLTNSGDTWTEADGQTMIDGKTWFYGSGGGGIWRTTNGGAAWTKVFTGLASGCVYKSKTGSFYVPSQAGVLQSADGVSWALIPGSPHSGGINGSCSIVGDGTTLYVSNGLIATTEPTTGWFWTAPEAAPETWTEMSAPPMLQGGATLAYDADHHLLYTSNSVAGFWRVTTP